MANPVHGLLMMDLVILHELLQFQQACHTLSCGPTALRRDCQSSGLAAKGRCRRAIWVCRRFPHGSRDGQYKLGRKRLEEPVACPCILLNQCLGQHLTPGCAAED